MSGYWVVTASEIVDEEAFAEYRKHWGAIAEKYNAKMLASLDAHRNVEGVPADRVTLVEFPSYEAALAAYNDPAYQKSVPFVQKAGDRNLFIVKGR